MSQKQLIMSSGRSNRPYRHKDQGNRNPPDPAKVDDDLRKLYETYGRDGPMPEKLSELAAQVEAMYKDVDLSDDESGSDRPAKEEVPARSAAGRATRRPRQR